MLLTILLSIKIPFTVAGIVTFLIVGTLAVLFLRWWFKRRDARTIKIHRIVTQTDTLSAGELSLEKTRLYFIDKNERVAHDLNFINECTVSEAIGSNIHTFRLQIRLKNGQTVELNGKDETHKIFFNEVLTQLEKDRIDWNKTMPQLSKIGNLIVNGYKIKVSN